MRGYDSKGKKRRKEDIFNGQGRTYMHRLFRPYTSPDIHISTPCRPDLSRPSSAYVYQALRGWTNWRRYKVLGTMCVLGHLGLDGIRWCYSSYISFYMIIGISLSLFNPNPLVMGFNISTDASALTAFPHLAFRLGRLQCRVDFWAMRDWRIVLVRV